MVMILKIPVKICVKVKGGMIQEIKSNYSHWDIELDVSIYDYDNSDPDERDIIIESWERDTKKLFHH
tara:strand:- start:533 stop:733 length:201 start_codon:yes stop_codon:yes gene_type:complete